MTEAEYELQIARQIAGQWRREHDAVAARLAAAEALNARLVAALRAARNILLPMVLSPRGPGQIAQASIDTAQHALDSINIALATVPSEPAAGSEARPGSWENPLPETEADRMPQCGGQPSEQSWCHFLRTGKCVNHAP